MPAKENKYKYIQRYKKEKLARVVLDVKPEEKTAWKEAADKEGLSLAAFVKKCIERYLKGPE